MLLSAFIFGVLSSFHCIGMCGPIVFALPVHKEKSLAKWAKILAYHFGRILTYATIGLLFGFFGRGFQLAGLQQVLSVVLGVLFIVIALSHKKVFLKLEKLFSKRVVSALKKMYQRIKESSSIVNFFSLGLLNGLLPCGMVYVALIGAMAMQNVLNGAMYMALFGLGTLPLLLVVSVLKMIKNKKFEWAFKKIIPVVLFVTGALLILRGMGLGIAFVSPSDASLGVYFTPVGCH